MFACTEAQVEAPCCMGCEAIEAETSQRSLLLASSWKKDLRVRRLDLWEVNGS